MKRKVIKLIIFAALMIFTGIIIWKKISYISTDEIFQEKSEQFYENQESFEKIITYVSNFDFRSIIENNEIKTDIMVDGIMFRLMERENDYTLSPISTSKLLQQLTNSDGNALILSVIGEGSSMSISYDKKRYNILAVRFSIEDTRLEDAWGSLIWHNLTYKPMADWEYPLDENWTIATMGVGY